MHDFAENDFEEMQIQVFSMDQEESCKAARAGYTILESVYKARK